MLGRTLRLVATAVAGVCLNVGVDARAAVFEDDFAESPFGSTSPPVAPRWCERFHHVHWDDNPASDTFEMMFGINGDCCEGLNFCGACTAITGIGRSCNENCSPLGTDSAAPGCKNLLISSEDFVGDDRRATIAFGLPSATDPTNPPCANPTPAISVATAAHPHCETAFEARVIPVGGGDFGLEIRSVTTPLTGFPECGSSVVVESSTIDAAATFTPALTITPRYEITLRTFRSSSFPSTKISATAEVVDTTTQAAVAVATKGDFSRPAWYDRQAQRFAFGGSFPLGLYPAPYDDFSGATAIVPPPPTDPLFPNHAPLLLDPGEATDIKAATEFLYAPSDPTVPTIQVSFADPLDYIDPNKITLAQAAVIRGKVLTEAGAPLPGVSVHVQSDTGFGRTHTRMDGAFDLAVNGGRQYTLVYGRPGFLPAQRRVAVPLRDYVTAPDVVLVERDPAVTEITLSDFTSDFAVARGTATADDDGAGPATARRATVLFAPSTTATMVLPGGSEAIDTISVRATEYTVGPNGPKRMPGDLPPESAYTYAVELSIDEAEAQGAERVSFSPPAVFYVENFLGFPFKQAGLPIGEELVPVGYYDREKGAWVSADNGRFVRIVSKDSGTDRANLDLDGDGDSDGADVALYAGSEVAITDEERDKLGELYAEEQVLWRARIPHFSPWDLNWGFSPPPGGGPCECSPPDNGDGDGDPPDPQCGSVISCQTQTLGESLPVTGTPFELTYQSGSVLGYKAGRSLRIYVDTASGPATAPDRIDVEISIGGQRHTVTRPGTSPGPIDFTWDGKDAYGRLVYGRFPARVRVDYVYRGLYERVARFGYRGNGLTIVGSQTRQEVAFPEVFETALETWDARGQGLGGWTLDQHHAYDPVGRVLHLGNGAVRRAATLPRVIKSLTTSATSPLATYSTVGSDGTLYFTTASQVKKVAPDGTISTIAGSAQGYSGDGGPALSAQLSDPSGLDLGPDDALYIADGNNHRIRRIDLATSIITTVVGCSASAACTAGWGGDGGPALDADVKLNQPNDVKVGPDGSLYIAERGRIRRVTPEPERIITTIAGDGDVISTSADGTAAFGNKVGGVGSIAVGRDGSIYFPSTSRQPSPPDSTFYRIRRIGLDGRLGTVAGKVGPTSPVLSGDGGPATDAQLVLPRGISIAGDGSLYFVDGNGSRVRRVGPDGIITTFAGNGTLGFSGDDGPAALAQMNESQGTAVGPDGSVFIGDTLNGRHRRVAPIMPGIAAANVLIPSEDGREVYEFLPDGRHSKTRDAFTGATVLSFAYTSGRLTSITDRSGNVTTIQRTLGAPTAIVAPGGQVTSVALTDEYLSAVTNPASESTQLTYVDDGLLRTLTDPRGAGHTTTYTYDGVGRLVRDDDPIESPFKELERTALGPSATASFGSRVDVTTAMGRVYAYVLERLSNGATRRTNTSPALLETVTTKDPSDRYTASHPDGTQAMWGMAPEGGGRFGMLAPVWTNLSISTPLMRSAVPPQAAVLTQSRTAALATAGNPFSLTSLTETFAINGRTAQRVYDAATRKLTDTSAAGRKRFTTLDTSGRTASVRVEGLEEVRFEYDSLGRLERIEQGAGTAERVYTLDYDGLHRLASITNPMPAPFEVTSFGYDDADRVTSQTLADTSEIEFGYDDAGNLTSLTPPGKPAHGFGYTATNLEATYAPPMPTPALAAPQTQYAYNPDRQLDLVTRPHAAPTPLPADVQVDYVYESETERLSKIVLPADEGEIAFAYDATTGQLAKATGPDAAAAPNPRTMTLVHDGFLELSTTWGCETPPCPAGTVEGSVSREYDASFRVVTQTVNGTDAVTLGYDDDDLLTSVTLGGATLTLTRDTATQKAGLITATALGGVTDTRTYNGFGEIESVEVVYDGTTPLYSVQYPSRDKLGRITEKVETIARPGGGTDSTTTVYTYDEVGRLETVNVTGDATYSATYAYDANGNRTAAPNLTGAAVYDPQDRLLQYGTGGPTYEYTANGELATKTDAGEVTEYEYDAVGNLRQVTITPPSGPATEIEYVVDGRGRRIGRKVGGVLEQGFLYDGQLRIVAELDGSNAVVSRFAYGTQVNVPELMRKGGETYRLITDHLGSMRLVVNVEDGSIAQRIDYDEFGNAALVTGTWSLQPFGLAGGLYDALTGVIRFGARDYDAQVGRWTAKDPILFTGGDTYLYAYSYGDPVNLIDPSGEAVVVVPLVSGVLVGGIAAAGTLAAGGSGAEAAAAFSLGFVGGFFGGFGGGTALGAAVGGAFGTAAAAVGGGGLCEIAVAGVFGSAGGAVGGLPGAGTAGLFAGAGLGGATGLAAGVVCPPRPASDR